MNPHTAVATGFIGHLAHVLGLDPAMARMAMILFAAVTLWEAGIFILQRRRIRLLYKSRGAKDAAGTATRP